jgi:hypothetical protein
MEGENSSSPSQPPAQGSGTGLGVSSLQHSDCGLPQGSLTYPPIPSPFLLLAGQESHSLMCQDWGEVIVLTFP